MKFLTLFLPLFFLSTAVYAQAPVGTLERETLLHLDWGNRPGEIGLIVDPPGFGPESFLVDDDGVVYILDSVNHRMSVFNAGGELENIFPVLGSGETCWSDDGDIYLNAARHHEIVKYSVGGKLLEKYAYDLGAKNRIAPSLDVKNGIFYLVNYQIIPDMSSYTVGAEGVRKYDTLRTNVKKEDTPRITGEYSGNKYIVVDNICYVELPNGQKNILFDKNNFGDVRSAIFLAEDMDRKSYFCIIYGRKKLVSTMSIQVYNSDLQHIAQILDAPLQKYTNIQKHFFVSNEGVVYQMHTENTGVYIYKWKK